MKITFIPVFYLLVGPDDWHTIQFGPLSVAQLLSVLTTWADPQAAYRASWDTDHPENAWLVPLCTAALHDYNDLTAEEEGPSHSFSGWRWLGIALSGEVDHSGTSLWIKQTVGDARSNVAEMRVSEHDVVGRVRDAAQQAIKLLQEGLST
jgi:hypothetical protein